MWPLCSLTALTVDSAAYFSSFYFTMYVCNERLSLFFNDQLKKKNKKQVPDIRDEETYGSEGMASILDWKPAGSASEGSLINPSRKPISALSPQVCGFRDTSLHEHSSFSCHISY